MTKSVFKKLPKGWMYLLSKKDIRSFLQSCPGHVCIVNFRGVGRTGHAKKKVPSLWGAGEVSVRGTEDGWRYKIDMWGFPHDVVGEQQSSLRSEILYEMSRFISEFESKKLDPLAKTLDLRFYFYLKDGVLEPSFTRAKVDSLFLGYEEQNPWWL